MVSLLVAFVALYFIHHMVENPQVLSAQKVKVVGFQFFFTTFC